MAECPGDEVPGVEGVEVAGRGESGSSDEYEVEAMTAAEVLEKLEEAWLNEKFAPELLEHKTEIVECILEQIREMEENLSHVRKGDFVAGIHKLELNRIRFVLCSYLRTRLKKIEQHVVHVLEQEASREPGSPSRLSPEELIYAKEFADNMDTHLHSLVLRHMPSNLQKMDRKKAVLLPDRRIIVPRAPYENWNTFYVSRPNLDSYVFVRAVERTEQVIVDPEDEGADREAVDFEPGNQYIVRYSPISSLVHSGVAKLV